MDVDKLLMALEDESNESLLDFTTEKMHEMTLSILKELKMPPKETMDIYKKLLNYKYVDGMDELKYGTFIRWIPLQPSVGSLTKGSKGSKSQPLATDSLSLTKGALFCEMKITDQGVFMVCKNYGFSAKHFQISLDHNLIFQKLTDQEMVLLSALDHLSSK